MKRTNNYNGVGRKILMSVGVATILYTASPAIAAGPKLPKPYVSRGLDATLIPIDANVRRIFRLAPNANGVLVLAVNPKGVAARSNIRPGDVIGKVGGRAIARPVDLDTAIYYGLKRGVKDFLFDAFRGSSRYKPRSTITTILYAEPIDVRSAGSWSSIPAADGFSYASYYSENITETVSEYSSVETSIEETASSESYASEELADDGDDADVDDEADADDEGDASDDADEADDEADADDETDGADDAEADDEGDDGGDDGGDEDEGGDGDDGFDDVGDDGGDEDDGGDDDGGDDDADEPEA